ncbi:MAG: glucose-1-phosphate thymidylyltransferase, partial [Proteobacteria bacterium]|nr:glucose-1-phosphate thymidylyltransferase [Pseudomonadota bacterium]
GELEITDLNRLYLDDKSLSVEIFGRGFAWLDTGSHESMLKASQFVEAVEKRQGLIIACPEEIAYRKNWIDSEALDKLAKPLERTDYGRYLRALIDGDSQL